MTETTDPRADRLEAAARRALESLNDLILDSRYPGPEAIAARYELEQVLLASSAGPAPAADPTERRDRWETQYARYDAHDYRDLATIGMAIADAEQTATQGECQQCSDRSAVDIDELRRMAGEAQQPETQAAADCPYGEGPGDGSGCIKPAGHDGDHVVTSGVAVVPCSRAVLQQPHIPHVWWPQPGMAYVQCPGHSVDTAAASQPAVARQADTAGEQPAL